MNKIKVGVLFGGKSTEHDVTIWSAKSIIKNLDPNKYEIVVIGIDKQGKFHFGKDEILKHIPKAVELFEVNQISSKFPKELNGNLKDYIDVAFPVLHGNLGEDGAIQGFLKILDIPFVGPDILSSAMCMDKEITKLILQANGIKVANFISLNHKKTISYEEVIKILGDIVFVKPSSSGSSVGVSKVRNASELEAAIAEAYKYDNKILIETAIQGKEIECAVIGNQDPKTSDICGRVVIMEDFYDYDAKYLNPEGAKIEIPADISESINQKAKSTAIKAYKALNCEGMCRVDMFVTETDILVNELNTIPGFVSGTSMYPMLLCKSGYSYDQLIDQLISLAIERYNRDSNLYHLKFKN